MDGCVPGLCVHLRGDIAEHCKTGQGHREHTRDHQCQTSFAPSWRYQSRTSSATTRGAEDHSLHPRSVLWLFCQFSTGNAWVLVMSLATFCYSSYSILDRRLMVGMGFWWRRFTIRPTVFTVGNEEIMFNVEYCLPCSCTVQYQYSCTVSSNRKMCIPSTFFPLRTVCVDMQWEWIYQPAI